MASYIYDSMHPYQRTGAHFARRAGSALIADQPGLGKTIQTLGSILAVAGQEKDDRQRWHLIVAPKVAVRNVWEPEILRWLKDHPVEVVSLVGTLAQRQEALASFTPKPETRHVFVVGNIEAVRIAPVDDTYPKSLRSHQIIRYKTKGKNPTKKAYHPENALIPALFSRVWDTIVCDESHRALIRTDGVPTQTRAGFLLLGSRRRIALSGTPMRGKPEQLWGTLNWLRPDLYRSYWNWVKAYFQMESNRYSNYIVGGLTEPGKHRLAEDLRGIMLRRTKAEVAPELPPKTYAGSHVIPTDDLSPLGIWLDMTPKQKKQYDRLVVEGLIGNHLVNGTLAEYTRVRQIAGGECEVIESGEDITLRVIAEESPKFQWLVDWLEENEDAKIVVSSQYTATVLEPYAEALTARGYKVASITGKTSETKRSAAIDGFQNGDVRVMLLNKQAGGVALTLDAADYLVHLDETTIPDIEEQVEDRIHRVSRNHNVTIYHLRMLDTIEEEVAYIAAARQDVQRYLLDGARGVEFAKQVYLTSRADNAARNTTQREKETV